MHFVQPNPKTPHLTFIGGGTLARAILDGLSKYDAPKTEHSAMYSVSITARRKESVGQLRQQYPGAYVTDDNEDEKLWKFATANTPTVHIVLICTQPQSTFDVCKSIRLAHEKTLRAFQSLPIVVTMCPGITIPTLESWLTLENHSKPFSVVRTMPNTPVSICQGATALATSRHVKDIEFDNVVKLFRIFSPCVEKLPKEELLDVAAAVSG
jgi:pyrroline-5-carboxylate reductase